jgi:uronate dehydrogenase
MTDEKPILLTGAAGTLGRWLRPRLIDRFGALLSSDIVDGGETHANERFVRCDLADGGAVAAGFKKENPFSVISPL